MPRQSIGLWPLILAVVAFGGAASAKETNAICHSSKGSFSTRCPRGWSRLDASDDSISVISFPSAQREEGVVIKDGGAQIIVSKHKLDSASLAQWIKKDNMGTRILTRTLKVRYIRNAACANTTYLEVDVDQGGPPSEVDSQIYCYSSQNLFKFQLRYWANDRKSLIYKSALVTMFDNFRIH